MTFWLILLGVLSSCPTICRGNKYDNYTFLRMYPQNFRQHILLESIGSLYDIVTLKRSRGFNDSLDMLVPPAALRLLEQYGSSVPYNILTNNFGMLLRESHNTRGPVQDKNCIYCYKSYKAMEYSIKAVVKNYPEKANIEQIGLSYEGRQLNMIKLSLDPDIKNPIIFVDAGIHAREWVAPAMALFLIKELVKNQHAELQGVDWYIMPIVNPDGYEYTRSHPNWSDCHLTFLLPGEPGQIGSSLYIQSPECAGYITMFSLTLRASHRFWRKTRSRNGKCHGVDGNRNYGFQWGKIGASSSKCSEIYAGPTAFSEPETTAIAKVMRQYKNRIKLYVSMHSYGDYMLIPWSYTADEAPPRENRLNHLAELAVNAVKMAGGPELKAMRSGAWYPTGGGSDDYAFGAMGIPYAYTLELTEGNTVRAFVYPKEKLRSVLPKYYEAFKAFGRFIRKEFSLSTM